MANEMMIFNPNQIETAVNNGGVWSTFLPETPAEKAQLFRALESSDEKISDYINKDITIANIVFSTVEVTSVNAEDIDPETGEVKMIERPKTVIIDDKGKTYSSVASGIFSSMKNLLAVFGLPDTWGKPMTVTIRLVKTKKGQTYRVDPKF